MTKGRDVPLISIVDDNSINIDVLSSVLSDAGIEIAEASDSETLFNQLGHALPDLIILDIKLPGVDGLDICRRLKADAKTRAIPVIFMTGLSDTLDKVRGLEVGAVDYITKPFQRDELLARVQVHLRLRRLERGLIEQTAELTRSLEELRQVREELQRANEALDGDVKLRTEELRDANRRLELELAEHRRTEAARAGLQQEIIDVQRRRLAELSTPLIPITDRIMVMPLIGTMDAERARQVLETALDGVKEHRTEVVILDITGVKVVDADVAGTLLRTASALRLLGARAVITGIRPEVAQSLVALGIDLGTTVTQGTLERGIAYAMGQPGDWRR